MRTHTHTHTRTHAINSHSRKHSVCSPRQEVAIKMKIERDIEKVIMHTNTNTHQRLN